MSADHAKQQVDQVSGVSNLAYDLITLLHNKLQAIAAFEAYKADCGENQEAASLFDDLQRDAVRDLERIKPLLVQELGR